MALYDIIYRLRLRNAADTVDDLTVTSDPAGTNPYLAGPPEGDGFGIDIITGAVEYGSYSVLIADVETGPGIRLVTSKLADIAGQYDKLTRKVVVEKSINGGAYQRHVVGFVTNISFPDEITAQLEFGDGNRAAATREIFVEAVGTFDRGTSIIGGPIRDGFAGMEDHGPWRMKVTAAASGVVTLRFVRGPVPRFATGGLVPTGGFNQATGSVAANVANYLNTQALHYARSSGTGWYAPGLTMRLTKVSTGVVTQATPLMDPPELLSGSLTPIPKLVHESEIDILWVGTLPAVNDEFDVYVTPIKVSETNPLHIAGHAIDIQTGIWTDQGVAWDAAAAAAAKAAIGQQRQVFLSIDKPWNQDRFETLLRGVFGFSYDEGPAGEKVLKAVRRRSDTLPAVTLTETDILGDENGDIPDPIFELDESSIVNKVTLVQTVFRPVSAEFLFARLDALVATSQTDTVTLPGSAGDHEVRYELPGMVVDTFALGFSIGTFGLVLAAEILSRFGLGCPSVTLVVGHGVLARVGDPLTLSVAHQINGNVRGGDRVIQVVHRTEMEDGVQLEALDGGLGAQVATVPTFSLAASGTDPKRYFSATITNAATLAAAGYTVRAEWAEDSSTPTTGATLAIVDPATSSVIASPRVDAGAHVWVRMRAEHPDQRPTAFSAWQGLDLADLAAPFALAHVGNVLSWTPGEVTSSTEVLWRPSAESVDTLVARLPPGSVRFDLTPYVPPGLSINATVRHSDDPPYAGESGLTSIIYTTPGAAALSAPAAPSAWVGPPWAGYVDGSYGIEVTGTVYPSLTEMEVSTETGVGTGVYGAYALSATVETVADGRTRLETYAANDRLRRKLRARHRVGAAVSGYSAVVGPIDPWTYQAPVDYPVAVPSITATVVYTTSDRGEEANIRLAFAAPTDPQFVRMEWQLRSRAPGATTFDSGAVTMPGSKDGPDLVPATFATEYQIVPVTVMSDDTRNAGAPLSVIAVAARSDPTPTYGTPVPSSTNIEYPIIGYDNETKRIAMWTKNFAADPGLFAIEKAAGALRAFDFEKGDGILSRQAAVDATNPWQLATFIPYDKDGNRGPVQLFKTQRTTPTPPGAPGSWTVQSNPSPATGAIVRRVPLNGSAVAGWKVRTYRNGVAYGTDRTLVGSDITAGYVDVTDAGVAAATTYLYKDSHLNASSVEGATNTETALTTGSTTTLATPTGLTVTRNGLCDDDISWGAAGNPAGTTYKLKRATTGAYTQVASGVDMLSTSLLAHTLSHSYKVQASKAGYTDSADSAAVTIGGRDPACPV